jgi:hypothetical protein
MFGSTRLEELAERARVETRKNFGRTIWKMFLNPLFFLSFQTLSTPLGVFFNVADQRKMPTAPGEHDFPDSRFISHFVQPPQRINGSALDRESFELRVIGCHEQRTNFRQIYLARPIVPLNNKDIGFLPGDIKAKINPYMEPLWDNLKVIQNQYSENSKEYQKVKELVDNEKLMVTPLAYIRGRSLANIIFIVDEAQNLTPLEVKTIITRAGEGTKIIFTGDINQIDTPYLDSQSNGLSFMIDRLKGQPLYAHITLEKGERSELANLANELL